MKRTAVSGVKENLKPQVYKESERREPRWRAFCLMSLRVGVRGKAKPFRGGAEAKASPKRAISRGYRTRSGGDLPLARLKHG